MNRRKMLALLVGTAAFPCGLISATPKERPLRSSCKDCKKCGRFCKCECSKGCKCKPGCCRKGEPPILGPAFERPPQGNPQPRPSHGGPPQGNPFMRSHGRTFGHPRHTLPKKPNHVDHEIMMRKFDENKDGKIRGEEKETAYRWFRMAFDSANPGNKYRGQGPR